MHSCCVCNPMRCHCICQQSVGLHGPTPQLLCHPAVLHTPLGCFRPSAPTRNSVLHLSTKLFTSNLVQMQGLKVFLLVLRMPCSCTSLFLWSMSALQNDDTPFSWVNFILQIYTGSARTSRALGAACLQVTEHSPGAVWKCLPWRSEQKALISLSQAKNRILSSLGKWYWKDWKAQKGELPEMNLKAAPARLDSVVSSESIHSNTNTNENQVRERLALNFK